MVRPLYGESLLVGKSLQELLQPQTVDPDSTIVEVFGEKSKDADDTREKVNSFASVLSSTGGKNIFGQEVAPLTEEDLMMMLPMGGSIRGGKVAKQAFNPTIKKMMNKLFSGKKGKKLLKSEFTPDELEWMRKRDAKKALEKIQERNMLSKARMQLKQTQDKYKIADPDKAEYLDTISALLTKWSKN